MTLFIIYVNNVILTQDHEEGIKDKDLNTEK